MARKGRRKKDSLPVIDLASMNLRTRNVFVDTSVFFNLNFNFKSAALASLAELGACGKANILLTDITRKEVKKQIAESVQAARAATNKARDEARILSNIQGPQFKGMLDRWDQKQVLQELVDQFKDFQEQGKVKTVPVNAVSIEEVFDKYFNSKPPFGTTADKKHEFPDAFVVAGLRNWCKESKSLAYVISTDKGMCAYCCPDGPLIALTSLPQFLELVSRQQTRLAKRVHELMRSHANTVQEIIRKEFEWGGFFLTDQDGDVENVEVQEIELGEELLITIDDHRATLEVDAEIAYSADVSYADMDTAIKDEGELIPWRTIHESVERTVSVPAEILLEFDPEKPGYCSLSCLKINNGQDIEVEADEYDWAVK